MFKKIVLPLVLILLTPCVILSIAFKDCGPLCAGPEGLILPLHPRGILKFVGIFARAPPQWQLCITQDLELRYREFPSGSLTGEAVITAESKHISLPIGTPWEKNRTASVAGRLFRRLRAAAALVQQHRGEGRRGQLLRGRRRPEGDLPGALPPPLPRLPQGVPGQDRHHVPVHLRRRHNDGGRRRTGGVDRVPVPLHVAGEFF